MLLSGMGGKVFPGLFGVAHDLITQGLQAGELLLSTEMAVELHPDGLAVQVPVKIQDKALH